MLENDTSLAQYAREVTRFVTFALSTVKNIAKTDYRLPLSDIAKTKASELFSALEKGSTEQVCMDILHDFLVASVATPNPKSCENRWEDVLICWMSVRGLKFATQFISPEDYMQLIAKWQYALRCICFFGAWLVRDNYGETRLFGYVLINYTITSICLLLFAVL